MLFYFLMLCAGFVGAVTGAEFGAKLFGIVGGIAGALLGGCLGYVIGCLPYVFAMISTKNDLDRKSVEELHTSLRGVGPMCPNFVLLELQARGEDIEQHLPFILAMMEAPDVRLSPARPGRTLLRLPRSREGTPRLSAAWISRSSSRSG